MMPNDQLQLNLQASPQQEKTSATVERLPLNDQQQAIVDAPLHGAVQVMAGAGTGKTEVITRRFAQLVQQLTATNEAMVGDPTECIFTCTFTEKAASEMRSRIEAMVAEETAMVLSPQAWIGTFHGLCYRMLLAYGSHVGFLNTTEIISDLELDAFRDQCIEHLMLGEPQQWVSEYLSEEGAKTCAPMLESHTLLSLGIDNIERFFTDVVYQVIPKLKAMGVTPHTLREKGLAQIETFTQTLDTMPPGSAHPLLDSHEAYAHAWQQHLGGYCAQGFSFFPSDWHTQCETQKALKKGKNPPDETALLREALKPFYKVGCFVGYNGRKRKSPWEAPTSTFDDLHTMTAIEKTMVHVIASVYQVYQGMLAANAQCDFDDLIQKTITLLEDHPEIREQYQRQFAHIIVDEFQDSNISQLRLVQLLSNPHEPAVTLVGDRKQSIYGFRFAEPENLQVFFESLPQYQQGALTVNYRSNAGILAVANRIAHMIHPQGAEILEPENDATSEEALHWLTVDDGCSIGEATAEEAHWIAQTIAQLIAEKQYAPEEIVVLVRNHFKASEVADALRALDIPVVQQRQLGFFQNGMIQHLMALIALGVNLDDDTALIHVLQQRLSHAQLKALADCRQQLKTTLAVYDLSYYQVLSQWVQADEWPKAFQDLKEALKSLHQYMAQGHQSAQMQSPEEWLTHLIETAPLDWHEEAHEKAQEEEHVAWLKTVVTYWVAQSSRVTTLADVWALLVRAQEKDALDLPVQWMAQEGTSLEETEDKLAHAVRVMTVHGAKGLEFPVVFLAGVESYRKTRYEGQITVDFQYPGKQGFGLLCNSYHGTKTLKKQVYDTIWHGPRSEAEELRLFYVGVTRAKERLYVSSWGKSFPAMQPELFNDIPMTVHSVASTEEDVIDDILEVLNH